MAPLSIKFQECQSLEVDEPHDTDKSGRIYIPSHDKCIAIANQVTADVLTSENNTLYWAGGSDEEGSILQGGCGHLGYRSDSNGVPIHTHSNNQITIECDKITPFGIGSK